MKNYVRTKVENEILYHTILGSENWLEIGFLKDADIQGYYITVNGESYPIDPKFQEELKVIEEWNKIYPNGKHNIEQPKRYISEEEKAIDFSKFIMNSPEILLKLGIQTRTGV